MTIRKGEEWGTVVERPADLLTVDSDAGFVTTSAAEPARAVAITAGDLHRTLGGRRLDASDGVLRFPVDLLEVTLDEGETRIACAHVLVQRPWWTGGWWRGEVLMVMNAQFVGEWHVVSRGHPNDGRAEFCRWTARFGLRDRWAARRRLPTNGHVPHPLIETGSFRQRTWTFDRPLAVRLDGVAVGTARRIDVHVAPDAAVVHC